ncbi:UDP-glucose/GDP-mannose dehydrogenase [Methanococcus maripaludis C5]|uniref:UDP-N-acetyl-D-mannosamine dehydrogenase n=1 Tax=Methanococcus maripaludis (strain C5 / ATCC BAA-1333) TaxID=402880 RepID=A4FZH6_METM5|nr:nucleotide sugar dehydrogenase [Methanococcus maripaludis]ABO35610.1 UDP-glucose/GDP-mannose dehydrogenase [Methanococcus maripaludis C5]
MIQELLSNQKKISITGLGYVGLPLAVAFAEKGINVIGFDVNSEKIKKYLEGIDLTNEVGNEKLSNLKNIKFTSNESDLKDAKFHIVAVPTPVGKNNIPNLTPIEGASTILGRNLTKGSIVVYESTVYPGVTEEICVPILEKESGLICGRDFKVGYSPERINPGDRKNTLETIVKIVAGQDEDCLNVVADVYRSIIDAGVHRATSIKVAEAAKVIENAQRDVNIAFVNELSMIFDKMGIDTKEVLEAAGTKWNFLNFQPGLVGGHCIGVDPYYLTYKSEEVGHTSQLILSGRRINDRMSKFIAEKTVKKMIESGVRIKGAKVLVLGLTFKENVPDLRNSKVADLIHELNEYGLEILVVDPLADFEEAKREYSIELTNLDDVTNVDAIIFAVPHKEYLKINIDKMNEFYTGGIDNPVFIDIKGVFDKKEVNGKFNYWRL